MCWEFEELYNACFDHLAENLCDGTIDLPSFLKEKYGVKINDMLAFKEELFNFLSKLHNAKIIEPEAK